MEQPLDREIQRTAVRPQMDDPGKLVIGFLIAVQFPLLFLLLRLRASKAGPDRTRRIILIYSLLALMFAPLLLLLVVVMNRPSEHEDVIFRLRRMGWQITDETLAELFDVFVVDSSDTAVTPESLEQVGRLEHIGLLIIRDPSFSDRDMATLVEHASPRAIEELSLKNVNVTAEGLGRLRQLTGLKRLELGWIQLNETEVGALLELQSLQVLDISQAQVADEGLQRLRRGLPDCTIRH